MATKIDFKKLNSELLSQAHYLLSQWLPGGKIVGSEYTCGDLSGGEGQSLKININTGKWADFAADIKGGDLTSLYAAIHDMTQVEAARELSGKAEVDQSSSSMTRRSSMNPSDPSSQQTKKPVDLVMPTTPLTRFKHPTLKEPSKTWTYCNETGQVCFYISRYETEKGKELRPWSFNSEGKWCNKAWPENRPLYNVQYLKDNQSAVLIVEGEKACDAAMTIAGHVYNIVTWSGGAQAINKTNWTHIYGRKILIWPDADKPGIGAGNRIADMLLDHCPEVKVIDVSDLPQDGFDAADSGFDFQSFVAWAKPRARLYQRPVDIEVVENLPAMTEEPPKNDWGDIDSLVQSMEESAEFTAVISQDLIDELKELGLGFQSNGKVPISNESNVSMIFEKYPKFLNKFYYDEFHHKIFTTIFTEEPMVYDDTVEVRLCVLFQRKLAMTKISRTTISNAVRNYASYNIKNEPKDWMEKLTWDNNPRIESFFTKYMGALDSDYIKAVSKNFFISMVARIYRPGCKVDNMVILEGEQGIYKSSALKALGGNWYVDTVMDTSNKDFYQILQGQMLVELGELTSFNKGESTAIKRAITTQVDKFRAPFDKHPLSHGRTSVFVGTTNQDEYLDDPTGGRRFWPLKVTSIDLEAIQRDREQLFAEAIHCYKAGESWWKVPESAKHEQELRQEGDVWTEKVEIYINSPQRMGNRTFSIDEILEHAIHMDPDKMNKVSRNRIASILKKLGYRNISIRNGNGKVIKRWVTTSQNDTNVTYVNDALEQNNALQGELPNFAPGMGITPLNKN